MGESGGDYNALFNYSNRAGGPFAGVNVTEMTIDDLLQFSDPDGPYGQYVKSQIGRVSTPMGGFQVVGSTLRMAKQGLGLKGNEKFDEAMQNRIGEYIFNQQGAGAWEALKKGGGIMNFMPQQTQQPMMPKEEKQGFDFRGIAAALDPLIMPEMRAGDAIRAQMDKEKAKKRTNQTVAYLRGLGTAQGEQLAAMVESGQLKSSDAFRALMQLQQSDRDFEQEKKLIDYRAQVQGASDAKSLEFNRYKNAYPDKSDAEILEMMNAPELPTAFRSLDMQARAAGFLPKSEGGDGSYETFMESRGKGFEQAAKLNATSAIEGAGELGKAIDNGARATQLIDRIAQSPFLDGVLGKYQGLIPVNTIGGAIVYNRGEADLIQVIDNLENSVFLEAFQTLKGGGQITELEGEKAQRAIVNLSRNRSRAEFLQALNDYKEVINNGLARAKNKVRVDNPYTKDLVIPKMDSQDTTPSQQQSNQQLQPTHRYNPATNQVEPIQ